MMRAFFRFKQAIGPVTPFTETYDFQADEATDAELAGLSQHEVGHRLLAARGTVSEELEEIDRGYWGDMGLMSYLPVPGPDGPRSSGWTHIGSPGWLEELFPGWNEERAAGPPKPPPDPSPSHNATTQAQGGRS
jgi:hypothetical protein